MSKQLITANNIRELHTKGQSQVEVSLANCIITPEAREVANSLGISIIDQSIPKLAVTGTVKTANNVPKAGSNNSSACSLKDEELKAIREAVIARLPKGTTISDALINQLVCKAIQENKHLASSSSAPSAANPAAIFTGGAAPQKPSGVKLVKGGAVNFEIFEGAGKEKKVGLVDVIGAADNSSMAVGYMQWENAFFPWTLNYDEVTVVIEGELHIRHQGETKIGKVGDIIFIPKDSSIEFGTPTKVRFAYIAWPANWQQQ